MTVEGASSNHFSSLAQQFTRLGRELTSARSTDEVFELITHRAYGVIPAAEHAGISRGRIGKFVTVGPTSDLPMQVDALQYAKGTGPCVDAVLDDALYRVGDLRRDRRWPDFGREAAERYGVRSMLSVRMFLEDDDLLVGLNLYSSAVDAFDESDETTATLLATHGALAIVAADNRDTADNLRRALETSRQIGAAIGILMATYKVTYDQGFDLLRVASQTKRRKLVDIAEDVLLSGALELPAPPEIRERPPSGGG